MKSGFIRVLAMAAVMILGVIGAPSLRAQGVTTAALNGVVTDKQGAPVAGATVTIVHEPSATRLVTTTRSNGQYNMSGLRVGGPYTVTVTAKGLQTESQGDVYLNLDQAQVVDLSLGTEVIKLEALRVTESRDATFASDKMGTSQAFDRQQIAAVPTVRRDVQDLVNLDSRVGLTINTSTGEFAVSAQGQNSRFNSFLIDGQQANDPFGLNANGFAALRSPVPLDAIAALTIDLSPYDVTRSGFTGALINAVTKSGTNEFHGDIYTYYSGKNLRAKNPGQGATDPSRGKRDPLQEHTYGGTFGGPIVKDKLFFFGAFDYYKKTGLPYSPVIFQPDAAAMDTILAAAKTFGIEAGEGIGLAETEQKTYLGKIDWNISSEHRATLTYRRTESTAPVFSNGSSYTQLTSNAYQANRKNDTVSLVLNSNWTPDLRTEVGAAGSKYNGTARPYTALAPEVYINGVSGTNLVTGAPTVGSIDLGTNYSYQLNSLYTNDYNGHAYAEYSWGDHTFKFGGDVDKSGYTDVFGQYYAGRYAFASPAAFAAGTPNYVRYQQALTGGNDTVAAATYHYSYTDAALLLQDTWKPTTSLTITAGLRYDYPYFPNKPVYLPAFETAFGMRNNAVPTGNDTLAPRFGFNYKLPTKLKIQLRGGVGLFRGTNPAVWIGNSYGTTGLLNTVTKGSSTSSTTNPPLGAPFTPFHGDAKYVQTLPPPALPTPQIAFTDPNFETPTSWKENLAVDVTLPWLGLVATAEANLIQVEKGIYYQNINLKPSGVNPDGRVRYSGNTGLKANFASTGVYELTNTDKGGSESYSLQLARRLKDGWAFSASYTHTHATEVQPLTSSVANSNFTNRATFNPNENVARNSLYVVPDKFVISGTREFNFFKNRHALTRVTAVFRAQTGHAYSWVFWGDANNDTVNGNDSFYVPNGPDDPNVVWSTSASDPTGAVQKAAFWNFVNSSELRKYQGKVVPANSSYSPWQQTLDLHLEQDIPIHGRVKLALFADCLNFANLLSDKWGAYTGIDFGTGYSGYNRAVASATINQAGKYVYTFNSSTLTTPTVFQELSRWQLQVGARLEF